MGAVYLAVGVSFAAGVIVPSTGRAEKYMYVYICTHNRFRII